MREFYCTQKIRNMAGKILAYTLHEVSTNAEVNVSSSELKRMLKKRQISVTNLTLTRDGRIVNAAQQHDDIKNTGKQVNLVPVSNITDNKDVSTENKRPKAEFDAQLDELGKQIQELYTDTQWRKNTKHDKYKVRNGALAYWYDYEDDDKEYILKLLLGVIVKDAGRVALRWQWKKYIYDDYSGKTSVNRMSAGTIKNLPLDKVMYVVESISKHEISNIKRGFEERTGAKVAIKYWNTYDNGR